MAAQVQLLVGLGNPGARYANTRHNAGFWLLDEVAAEHGLVFRSASRFFGDLVEGRVYGHSLRLLKPTTYMNESGRAVGAVAKFYRFEPEEIVIAHDEIDLPVGTVRLKRGGGHGGHNGLRDIVPQLGSADFLRIRIGVGHPGESREVTGHVLKPAPAADQALIEESIARVLEQLPLIIGGDFQRAMNVLHRKAPPGAEP